MKLHAALVLNITYGAIYELRRDTAQWTWQGFQRQSEREKSLYIEVKLRKKYTYNGTSLRHKSKLFQIT